MWSSPYRAMGGETPAVYALLSIMGIVFIADWALHGALSALLSWPASWMWFRALPMLLWQPFTFPFVHDVNFLYLLTDGIVLFFFGGSLERAWGWAKFLFFFFASGIIAGLAAIVISLLLPGPLAIFVGMMGSWVAMVVAFSAMNPFVTVLLIVFPLQARWLGVLSVAWELFGRSAAYGGPAGAVAAVGATVCFAYFFATSRFSFGSLFRGGGPSLRDRMDRWQQKRRMRQWQRRVSRVERPEDLFKDKK
ncbi:MAG: rhomboid family intramembrane serine protease [Candidatus Eremiobacteraeota bacterium]|nr:rhomboid family intramembrane serine protease [Candidatus Eremiobacteraeota bacterium]